MHAVTLNPLSPTAPPAAKAAHAQPEYSVGSLTVGLAQGDDDAFRRFHDVYFDRLYCFLLVVTRGQPDEAEEALQQTFLRVARYARPFEDEDVFWCWLKNLARSAARDCQRRNRRYASLLERFWRSREPEQSPVNEDEHPWSELLGEALSELPVEAQELAHRRYRMGQSVSEIADGCGQSAKAVEARLSRLRAELRARVLRRLRSNETQ